MLALYFTLLTVLATGSLAVLNGDQAAPHQFPYHVGVYNKSPNSPMSYLKYYCGGAIISDQWVLTAGHCSYLYDYKHLFVKAGKHLVNQKETNEQVRFVVQRVLHPDYEYMNPWSGKPIARNDLALFRVDTPFIFNGYVNAARIPSTSAYFGSGSLAGWGSIGMESYEPKYPEELHYNAYLPLISPQACADAINAAITKSKLLSVEINSNQTCTGNDEFKRGAGQKDGGSALVNKENDKYVIIGIVAETNLPYGVTELPAVYTRVSAYSEWIKAIIKSS